MTNEDEDEDDDSYVVKFNQPLKLSSEERYLVIKVILVKEVMTCDVSPVAMFFYLENCLKAVTDSAAQDYGEYID